MCVVQHHGNTMATHMVLLPAYLVGILSLMLRTTASICTSTVRVPGMQHATMKTPNIIIPVAGRSCTEPRVVKEWFENRKKDIGTIRNRVEEAVMP